MIPPSAFETRHQYTVHGAIASGGMGTIRLGLQWVARGFSRVVAIKQIHAMYADSQEFVAMFRDELRVASRVVHPNVVPILDVVSSEDELSLVMEYVHGLSAARLLTSPSGAPSPEIATTVVIGMLHGLHAAHEALSENGEPLNVVHRDVTPHNVMVGVDGAPRLLDFGIAHALGRSGTTTVGRIKGKARYLAPEQLKGESVDRRADIYSASVVLWEMLTGRRLFRSGKDDRRIELASRHSVEGPHLIRPGISPDLSSIVLRGLQPDPDARYATALEMAVALEESAATVSATKVGEWVRRVWGSAELGRLEQIRAIERGVTGPSGPDDRGRHGHHRGSAAVIGETPSESPGTEMTVPGRFLGDFARDPGEQPREALRAQGPRHVIGRGSWPGTTKPPTKPPTKPRTKPRKKGGTTALAAVLVTLGSALALFVMRGGSVNAPRASIGAPAPEVQTALPFHIESIPSIDIMNPRWPTSLLPEGRANADRTGAAPTGVAGSRPASETKVTPTPPHRIASVDQAKRRGVAHDRSVRRKPPRTSTGTVRETDEEKGAARPTLPASPSCDPPYVIEDDGIKRFKLSCL